MGHFSRESTTITWGIIWRSELLISLAACRCRKSSWWYLRLLVVLFGLVFVFPSVQLWDVGALLLQWISRVVHLTDYLKVGSNEFWLVLVFFLLFLLKHKCCRFVFSNQCFWIEFSFILYNLTVLTPRIFLLVSILKPFVKVLVRFVFEPIIFISHDGSITLTFIRFVFWLLFDF